MIYPLPSKLCLRADEFLYHPERKGFVELEKPQGLTPEMKRIIIQGAAVIALLAFVTNKKINYR